MAPAHSKPIQTQLTGQRKRKASSRITDENFVGAESNVVTKRLKLSANRDTAQAAAVKPQQRQASVEDVADQDSTPVNNPPKNPNVLLEADDGSDDVEMPEDDPAPALEDVEPDEDDDEDDEDDESEPEVTKPVETAEAQRSESNIKVGIITKPHLILPIERLSKEWVSPIYAFFHPTPYIVSVDGRRVHEFKCSATNCKGRGKNPRVVRRYLDTSDRNSTGNLRKHARQCWGEEILLGADSCGDIASTREALSKAKKLKDGSITTSFERKGKGKVTFSHRQHDKTETRFVDINIHLIYLTWHGSGRKSFVGYRRACGHSILSTIEGFSV